MINALNRRSFYSYGIRAFFNADTHWSGKTQNLSRSFKDILGAAYSDFVLDAELERGAQMLVEGNEPIKNIISFLGYEIPSYYSKIFKNKYGVTPSQYRKEQTKAI
ncbi:helix-turn-helix transcriptional regulator [Lacrimispora sp.]|uniref:helix-turn-helix transcriptional regulator n=1 Tax=Lacrimispora sp. TaxID=2719234 RepID=UPI0028A61879|nr:helix-turn-helix transcriptional regulator [Lacrimispora sp.]